MNNVKRGLQVLMVGALSAGYMGAVSAGVVGSKHDLTTATGAAQATTASTDKVCVFCHTPHGSNTAITAPLWNKSITSVEADFARYSTNLSPSFDSAQMDVGSVSIACLSCHDGSQAMDVVLNAPGSGGYNNPGAELDGVAIGVMAGAPVPMLGTDLSNDHPVSMQYAAGGATSVNPDGQFAAASLGDTDFVGPYKATVNTLPVWWVDATGVGTAGVREKTDMMLYARNNAGTVEPFVECGSCHDPHNDTTGAAADSVQFLRINNTASAICTSCHVK